MKAEWETCKKHLSLKDSLLEFVNIAKKTTTNQPWSNIAQSDENTKGLFSSYKSLQPNTFTSGELKQSRGHLDWWGGVCVYVCVLRYWWVTGMAGDEVWFHSSGFPEIKGSCRRGGNGGKRPHRRDLEWVPQHHLPLLPRQVTASPSYF